MATKSEQFETEQRLARRAAQPAPRKRHASSATERPAQNQVRRDGKASAYEFEPSPGTRPSRKSTRRSPAHVKTDTALRLRTVDRNAAPSRRAQAKGGP